MRYQPSLCFRNPHLQTVWPTFFRQVIVPPPESMVLKTPDGDEILADHYRKGNSRLAILSHGLEGNTRRSYMLGMTKAFLEAGWDVLAWNNRSCGGRLNLLPTFYHSGFTNDLAMLTESFGPEYAKVFLTGFSMGGNITLKYLGESGSQVSERVCGAAAISVPCDLGSSSLQLEKGFNRNYSRYFLKKLQKKVAEKRTLFPESISPEMTSPFSTLREFDDSVTASLYGFDSAQSYYTAASSKPWLPAIRVPVLILNAKDDPFLALECYPKQEATENSNITLEMPENGGHVGFVSRRDLYFSEARTIEFASECAASV